MITGDKYFAQTSREVFGKWMWFQIGLLLWELLGSRDVADGR